MRDICSKRAAALCSVAEMSKADIAEAKCSAAVQRARAMSRAWRSSGRRICLQQVTDVDGQHYSDGRRRAEIIASYWESVFQDVQASGE
eukprot:693322-Pyramimonas_sp.AAC.1